MKQIYLFFVLIFVPTTSQKLANVLFTSYASNKTIYFTSGIKNVNNSFYYSENFKPKVNNSSDDIRLKLQPISSSAVNMIGGTGPTDDYDGDGITNENDLDDDNDGILDKDELVFGGTNSSVPEDIDTDNDGVPNRLDLDSDGDGCPDAIEGDGSFTNTNLVTDTNLNGGNTGSSFTGISGVLPVQQNLGTTVDTDINSARYGVPIVGTATSATTQEVGFSTNKMFNYCTDTDGDNIPDLDDKDDDNDGILDTDEGVCLLGLTYNQPITNLGQANNLPSGRYYFNFGNGTFQADVDSSNGGGWVLVAQYVHNETTNPTLSVIGANANLPETSNASLGTDESGLTEKWGHAGNAAIAQFGNITDVRFYGATNLHNRVIHFTTQESSVVNYFKTGTGGISNLPTNFQGLSNHTSNLPQQANTFSSNAGDFAMTEFPFYRPRTYNWAIRGSGTRWEVDDYSRASGHTIHKIWIKDSSQTNCTPLDTDNDGVPNYLDLDSDGDGCPDAIDGDGTFTNTNLVTDTNLNGGNTGSSFTGISGVLPVQQNLGTTVDTDINSARYGVPIVGTATSATTQEVGFSTNKMFNYCTDTDGDNIPDLDDKDDDNDGILDTDEGACNIGLNPDFPITSLSQAKNLNSGRYYFNLGNGTFQADVDSSNGGGWVLVAQYVHDETTNPTLNVIGANANLPETSNASLGTDESGLTEKWGHAGNAAIAQFGNITDVRFYGATNLHNRVIHFTTQESSVVNYFKTGTGAISNLSNNYQALSNHTSNLPQQAIHFFSNRGDYAMTEFPFYKSYNYHWSIKGSGSRWEVDDFSTSSGHTIHKVWIKDSSDYNYSVYNNNCTPLDTDNDGVPNHLDLDSDGDGCPDAVEGSGFFTTNNLVTDSNMNGGNTGSNFSGITGAPAVQQNLGTTVNTIVNSAMYGVPVVSPNTVAVQQDIYNSNDKTINYCTLDSDGDTVPDLNDLDDDNDGVLDKDELVFGGTNSSVPEDIDTDNDGVPNRLDLDSDDDGCADAIEGDGGFSNTVLKNSTIPIPSNSTSTVITNLGNTIDADGVPVVANGGQSIGFSQNDTFSSFCDDTDADGVNNYIDIDDDNDGIIDKLESDCEDSGLGPNGAFVFTGAGLRLAYYFNNFNASLYANDYISATSSISQNEISMNYNTNNYIEVRNVAATTLAQAKINEEYLEFQFTTNTNFYKGAIDWVSMRNPESYSGAYNVAISVSSDNKKNFKEIVTFSEASGDGDGGTNWTVGINNEDIPDYQILPNITYHVRVYFYDLVPDTGNNYILFDGLQLIFDFCKDKNTDSTSSQSDTNPNRLDLDSDGDGCPDAIESAVPTSLTTSVTNNTTGIPVNTDNAKIDISVDPVGTNGFANSLESGATDSGTVANAYTTTNYTNYGLDGSKNGCGVPMITQVHQSEGNRWVEITNTHTSRFVVPNSTTLALYKNATGNQDNVNPTTFLSNTTEIASGKSILIAAKPITNKASTALETINTVVTDFSNNNDQLILTKTADNKSYNQRFDIITNIKDSTNYVRVDEVLVANPTFTNSEWVAFENDNIQTYTNVNNTTTERHQHSALLSEIANANDQANIKPGIHRVLLTEKTASGWSNGFPDRSRHVQIMSDYNHTNTPLKLRNLSVKNGSVFTITDQLLVVSDTIHIATAADEIRLISTDNTNKAQLIQTHEETSKITGDGKLLIDQNTETPSVYRFNYLSSPVNTIGANTYKVADVLKDGTTPLTGSSAVTNIDFIAGYDGEAADGTNPIKIADYWIYTQGSGSNWTQKGSTGVIPQTDGFIMKGTGVAQNYTFVGSPKDGNLTTTIGADEFYLIGNPYPSALSIQKFLEDNLLTTTATAYFWQHAGEDIAEGTAGHNYSGYVGGYATHNIAMGIKADDPSISGAFNINLQAEDALFTGASEVRNGETVVALSSSNPSVKFENLVKGVDVLKLEYQTSNPKNIKVKVNGVFKQEVILPTSNDGSFDIVLCVEAGSTVAFESNDSNTAFIDLFRLYDDDGEISCAPSLGTGITYKVPGAYVPVGQGFFIQGDAGGSVEFNNSQREFVTEETAASVFFKSKTGNKEIKKSSNSLPIIKLGMDYLNNANNTSHRQIGISFKQNNTFQFDKGYDSEIFDINATDVYWKFDNSDRKYVIAGVQQITEDLEVPLEVIIEKNKSTIVFSIDEIQQITNDVFILDKLTGLTYQINEKSAAIVLDAGVYTDRFALSFTAQTALNIETVTTVNNNLHVYYNTKDAIELVNKNNLNIAQVCLYSLVGQEVKRWIVTENKSQMNNTFKVNSLASGVYIVKVHTKDKQIITKKLLIN